MARARKRGKGRAEHGATLGIIPPATEGGQARCCSGPRKRREVVRARVSTPFAEACRLLGGNTAGAGKREMGIALGLSRTFTQPVQHPGIRLRGKS